MTSIPSFSVPHTPSAYGRERTRDNGLPLRAAAFFGVVLGVLCGFSSEIGAMRNAAELAQINLQTNRAPIRSSYDHEGIDILAPPGTPVVSPVDGTIEIRDTYKDGRYDNEFRNIWVITEGGYEYGLFFVSPRDPLGNATVKNGDRVRQGDPIGTAQDRAGREFISGLMKNHIHIQIHDRRGKVVDPTPIFKEWQNRR